MSKVHSISNLQYDSDINDPNLLSAGSNLSNIKTTLLVGVIELNPIDLSDYRLNLMLCRMEL
jgi:hypothetical protein